MLSAMKQIGCDPEAWFDCRLSLAKCFFFFVSSAHVQFEEDGSFLLAESFTTGD